MIHPQMIPVKDRLNDGNESFFLIPISKDCRYIECRFNFQQKYLICISDVPIESPKMFPKLDDNGNAIVASKDKKSQQAQNQYKQERKWVKAFYDYAITDREDIEKFVGLMTGMSVNLDKYFKVPEPPKVQSSAGPAENPGPEETKLTIEKGEAETT